MIDDNDYDDFDEFNYQQHPYYNVPHIKIDSLINVNDFELMLQQNDDIFYRRIVEFMIGRIDGTIVHDTLAVIIDENDDEYELDLPEDGYIKSLNKALEYFVSIEEYETCDLIKQMIKTVEKDNEL